MTAVFESKLAKAVIEKLDEQDKRYSEVMASGSLADWSEYQRCAGYRRLLADTKILINETVEDILKE